MLGNGICCHEDSNSLQNLLNIKMFAEQFTMLGNGICCHGDSNALQNLLNI